MNKRGIALAADSAVTLGKKIYHTAEKLFFALAIEVIPTGFLHQPWIRHVDAYYSTATQPHRHPIQMIAPHLPQPCALARPRAWH